MKQVMEKELHMKMNAKKTKSQSVVEAITTKDQNKIRE